MAIESWPIDRPTPYERNARKWTMEAIAKVATSIREFGFRQPIVVDSEGVIIIGHLRLTAAKHLGLTHVPVHPVHDLTPAQVKALRIADNRTHDEATWDNDILGREFLEMKIDEFDLSFTGFEQDEILTSVFGVKEKKKGKGGGDTGQQLSGLSFKVIVECSDEEHQLALLDRFEGEGLICKALIS